MYISKIWLEENINLFVVLNGSSIMVRLSDEYKISTFLSNALHFSSPGEQLFVGIPFLLSHPLES
jgi:hypothetical protein